MKLGILGAGQLARMLSLAAHPLGIRTLCIDPAAESCASKVTQVIQGDFNDAATISQFLKQVDIVTYETENIPLECTQLISRTHAIYPASPILQIAQDRLFEKNFFSRISIPTPDFFPVDSEAALNEACRQLNFPCILKTRRMGYDGKGQVMLRTSQDLTSAWERLGKEPLILEKYISFAYEVSQISVRSAAGEMRFYPLVLNQHREGILRWSEAPHEQLELQRQAQEYAARILEELNYIGILTVEFFYDGAQLLANEMAPRVHNSGHWTIEGAQTSQFENHLRAIFGLPLGSTRALGHSFMLNCVGEMPALPSTLAIPGAHYHSYEKTPRPLRKLGHVTLVEPDSEKYLLTKQQTLALLP